MHVKAKRMALAGMMLALSIVCMMLGSVIESNTLFLLAAASYFVGIVIREMGMKTGAAFYLAGVLLGFILASNKFYVFSYAAMGLYILIVEAAWNILSKRTDEFQTHMKIFWIIKYMIFNLIYLPVVLCFPQLLFAGELSSKVIMILLAAGQVILFVYDRAYDYVQAQIWGRYRHRFIH